MKYKLFFISLFLINLYSISDGATFETFNPNLATISWFEVDSSQIEYIGNDIALLTKRYNMMTMDIRTGRIIDILKMDVPFDIGSINIFRSDNNTFICFTTIWLRKIAKVGVDNTGIFGTIEFLPDDYYTSEDKLLFIDNINNKIWNFRDKIRCIDIVTKKSTEIDYPEDFLELSPESIWSAPKVAPGGRYFVVRVTLKPSYYQYYLQIDTANKTATKLPFEKDFVYYFFPWKNHDSLSLYTRNKKDNTDFNLYIFNHETLNSEVIVDLGERCYSLSLNSNNNIAYIPTDFNSTNISGIGVINLESRTFEKHLLIGEHPNILINQDLMYDSFSDKMFAIASITEFDATLKFLVEINLETFEYTRLPNFPMGRIGNGKLLDNTSQIIFYPASPQGEPNYFIYDFEKSECKITIDLSNSYESYQDQSLIYPDRIGMLDRYGKVSKLVDLDSFQVSAYQMRRFTQWDIKLVYISDYNKLSLFPDASGFVSTFDLEGTINFNFNSGETISYDIPQSWQIDFIMKDKIHNRVVGTLTGANNDLIFFNYDITYKRWVSGLEYKFLDTRIDESTGDTWVAASKQGDINLYFLKFKNILEIPDILVTNKLPREKFKFLWNPLEIDGSFFVMGYDGASALTFSEWSPSKDEILFRTNIYTYTGTPSNLYPVWVFLPDKNQIFIYNGYNCMLYDIVSHSMLYGSSVQDPEKDKGKGLHVDYNPSNDTVVVADIHNPLNNIINEIYTSGLYKQTIKLPKKEYYFNNILYNANYYDDVFFNLEENKIYLIQKSVNPDYRLIDPQILTVHLDGWENAPTIKPRTNNVEYHPGNNLKLKLTVNNPGPNVNVTAYIWFWLADGTFVCFDATGISIVPKGINLTLPAGTDVSFDFIEFTLPDGLPQGYWTADALFFNNDTGQRGPISNYNFYYRVPE
jgi:hypothetical protein